MPLPGAAIHDSGVVFVAQIEAETEARLGGIGERMAQDPGGSAPAARDARTATDGHQVLDVRAASLRCNRSVAQSLFGFAMRRTRGQSHSSLPARCGQSHRARAISIGAEGRRCGASLSMMARGSSDSSATAVHCIVHDAGRLRARKTHVLLRPALSDAMEKVSASGKDARRQAEREPAYVRFPGARSAMRPHSIDAILGFCRSYRRSALGRSATSAQGLPADIHASGSL